MKYVLILLYDNNKDENITTQVICIIYHELFWVH